MRDLPEYTTTFINELKVANINIDYSQTSSDIRDLILLSPCTSNITVDFGTDLDAGLSRLLSNLDGYPDFCSYIRERSVRVIADFTYVCLEEEFTKHIAIVHRLEVDVKLEFKQEWIRNPTAPENKDRLQCWLHGLGLQSAIAVAFVQHSEDSLDLHEG